MRTVTVAAGRLEGWLAGFADRHGAPTVSRGERVVELVGVDGARARIEVSFPPLGGELVAHVLRPRRIGVLLVRRHGYAVGVFDGTNLVASKVGSAYVQGGTKAGGWSVCRRTRMVERSYGSYPIAVRQDSLYSTAAPVHRCA